MDSHWREIAVARANIFWFVFVFHARFHSSPKVKFSRQASFVRRSDEFCNKSTNAFLCERSTLWRSLADQYFSREFRITLNCITNFIPCHIVRKPSALFVDFHTTLVAYKMTWHINQLLPVFRLFVFAFSYITACCVSFFSSPLQQGPMWKFHFSDKNRPLSNHLGILFALVVSCKYLFLFKEQRFSHHYPRIRLFQTRIQLYSSPILSVHHLVKNYKMLCWWRNKKRLWGSASLKNSNFLCIFYLHLTPLKLKCD